MCICENVDLSNKVPKTGTDGKTSSRWEHLLLFMFTFLLNNHKILE